MGSVRDVQLPETGPDAVPAAEEPRATRGPGAVAAPGALPGTDPREAARTVLGELGEVPHVPHLPLLPDRGPGADPLGRTASLLVDLPVDRQPAGWRFVDAPGRDQRRADAFLRADLDELAEAADGWSGRLALGVVGPWTLLAAVELTRGERSVSDPGARRDVLASFAEGLARHVADVRRLVPGAALDVVVAEPSLTDVLTGRVPTQSGYGTLRAVDPAEVRTGLRTLTDAVRAAGAATVLRPGEDPPWTLLREARVEALHVDARRLGPRGWESVAVAVEDGCELWAGVLPTAAPVGEPEPSVAAVVDVLRAPWRRIGMPAAALAGAVVTPAAELADLDPARVRPLLRRLREVGAAVAESSGD